MTTLILGCLFFSVLVSVFLGMLIQAGHPGLPGDDLVMDLTPEGECAADHRHHYDSDVYAISDGHFCALYCRCGRSVVIEMETRKR